MAAGAPAGTVKTAKPQAGEFNNQETARPGPPTIREVTKNVAKLSPDDRLRILVWDGLMTDEGSRIVVGRTYKADRS
jgi:hypothetical protein